MRKAARAALALLAVLALLAALRHAGTALVVAAPIEAPDAIVMLASHEWERLPAAATLARRLPGARVILTVPTQPTYWNCFRCSDRVEWLGREGIGPDRVVELRGAANTYEEARLVLDYMRRHALTRLLIVTSPYHTRRSLATFRSLGGVSVGIAPAVSASSATPSRWWRYDTDRRYVAYEWSAIGAYAVRYGVWSF